MEHAATGLEKIVSQSLHRAPQAEAPLLAWPMACGHAVAERTRALDCVQGVLRVEVPDLSWRNELQALAPRYLAAIAVLVLGLHCLDVFWWVEPAYLHDGQYFFWLLDLAAVAAVGGLWVFCFLGELKQRPLLPVNDPGLPQVLEHAVPSEGTVS